MANEEPEYIDDYATCALTYATFCLYHDALDPEVVSEELGIEPTDTQQRGTIDAPDSQNPFIYTTGGWFLSSEEAVKSRDARRHIDWLLDQLEPVRATLQKYQAADCSMEISCYWLSASGHGGPTLSPRQMARLSALGLEVEFDAYALGGDDNYFARSVRTINEYARQHSLLTSSESAGATASSRAVSVVLRVDRANDPRVPLDAKIDVVGVYTTPKAAWREKKRLADLHGERDCKFLWTCSTLRDETFDEDPTR